MHTQSTWTKDHQFKHWLKHSLLPLLILVLVLLIPQPWQSFKDLAYAPIELSLKPSEPAVKPVNKPAQPPPLKPEPIDQPLEKALTTPPPRAQETPPKAQESPPIKPAEPQAAKPTSAPELTDMRPNVRATDVMRMIEKRTSIEVTPEFQARTGPAKDFYIPEQEMTDWYADIPFLDESVDKPQLTMHFYPEGIEGVVEKFFDKITISKTFTTKYGTKIHCALIGVIAACGWK